MNITVTSPGYESWQMNITVTPPGDESWQMNITVTPPGDESWQMNITVTPPGCESWQMNITVTTPGCKSRQMNITVTTPGDQASWQLGWFSFLFGRASNRASVLALGDVTVIFAFRENKVTPPSANTDNDTLMTTPMIMVMITVPVVVFPILAVMRVVLPTPMTAVVVLRRPGRS
jgi:hypothetical protein